MTDDATTPAGDDRAAASTGPDDSTAAGAFDTASGYHSSGEHDDSGTSRSYPDADSSSLFASSDNSSLYPSTERADPSPGSGGASPSPGGGSFSLLFPGSGTPGGSGSSSGSGTTSGSGSSGGYASSDAGDRPGEAPAAGRDAPADEAAATAARPDAAQRQRRRLIGAGIAVAAVLILAICGGLGAFAAVVSHVASAADDRREVRVRTDSACLELERRLNRLAPPGAATDPGRRAAAIRDENAAVRPFLSEIDQLRGRWPDDNSGDDDADGRQGWPDGWRQLVDARNAYADALDRQVTNGEPAFFLAPQDRRGRPVLDRLQRGPQSCAGAGRRLAAPDL